MKAIDKEDRVALGNLRDISVKDEKELEAKLDRIY